MIFKDAADVQQTGGKAEMSKLRSTLGIIVCKMEIQIGGVEKHLVLSQNENENKINII